MDKPSATIFTDGASKGNPGPGGWGVVIVYDDSELKDQNEKRKVLELGGREGHTTNNRMELTAAIRALTFLQGSTLDLKKGRTLIYSDSSYLINGITKWVKGWKRNGWKTTFKKDVENRDLWEKLSILVGGLEIEWRKVAGHAGIIGNERCDEIATAFAEGKSPTLYKGNFRDYSFSTLLKDKKLYDISYNLGAGKNRQKTTAYSYVSFVGGVVKIHKTWEECKKRVEGKNGARFKKVFSREEEEKLIKEFQKITEL